MRADHRGRANRAEAKVERVLALLRQWAAYDPAASIDAGEVVGELRDALEEYETDA